MWRVGVVGAGYWARNHLIAWSAHPRVKVSALCDRDAARLASRGEEFALPPAARFTDVEAMLAGADLDIVDIVTPPSTHLPFVASAARAGKHILCIKPLAGSIEEAREMAELAGRYGVRAMVAENWRWFEPLRELKRVLDGGRIGRPYYARYDSLEFATPRMGDEREMDQPFLRRMPRLLFYEMGVHWFDVWRFLFGEPRRVYAEMRHVSPQVAGEDVGLVTIAHSDLLGLMEMSWVSRRGLLDEQPHHERMIIEGDRGTVIMKAGEKMRLVGSDGAVELVAEESRFDRLASIRRLQSHFLRGIEEALPFETGIDDNLKTLELVFAAYWSAENHAAKSWST